MEEPQSGGPGGPGSRPSWAQYQWAAVDTLESDLADAQAQLADASSAQESTAAEAQLLRAALQAAHATVCGGPSGLPGAASAGIGIAMQEEVVKLDGKAAWEFGMLLLDKTVGRYVPVRFIAFGMIGGLGVLVHMAVLLAAMLRSRGIPARVAYGLVHAEAFAGRRNVFAWHMWTRAWIGDRWVDLDATRPRAFGPTHIRLGESAGEQAVLQELTATLLGTGRIEIRVLGGER